MGSPGGPIKQTPDRTVWDPLMTEPSFVAPPIGELQTLWGISGASWRGWAWNGSVQLLYGVAYASLEASSGPGSTSRTDPT